MSRKAISENESVGMPPLRFFLSRRRAMVVAVPYPRNQ
jgi:hypothetical protein